MEKLPFHGIYAKQAVVSLSDNSCKIFDRCLMVNMKPWHNNNKNFGF